MCGVPGVAGLLQAVLADLAGKEAGEKLPDGRVLERNAVRMVKVEVGGGTTKEAAHLAACGIK